MNDSCSDESIRQQLASCGIYNSAQLAEKSSKDKSLSSLQMCVEKELPDTRKNILQMASMSGEDINIVSAAYFKSKIWPKSKKTLKIQFLEEGNNVRWTDFKLYQTTSKIYQLERELNSTSPYRIRNRTSGKEAVIQTVKKILQPLVGIKFEFVNSYGDIRIGFEQDEGAYSNVGTDCAIQEGKSMNLGWLDVATILHEFLHALGCIHEHQNPKGGIKWNTCKVYEWARRTQDWDPTETCPNIIQKYSQDQLNASSYDPESIMLYYFPSALTEDSTEVKKNLVLSDTDIEWLRKIYPGGTGLTDEHRRIKPNEQITKKIGPTKEPTDVNNKKLSCIASCNESLIAKNRNCNKLKSNKKITCLSNNLRRRVECINKCNSSNNMSQLQDEDSEGENRENKALKIGGVIIGVILFLLLSYLLYRMLSSRKENKENLTGYKHNIIGFRTNKIK
jgi:hypothetical protein